MKKETNSIIEGKKEKSSEKVFKLLSVMILARQKEIKTLFDAEKEPKIGKTKIKHNSIRNENVIFSNFLRIDF